MLSEALQRNAKHEARLSNISGYQHYGRTNQRFFSRNCGIKNDNAFFCSCFNGNEQ